MKTTLLIFLAILLIPALNFALARSLGTVVAFVLFSSKGTVDNASTSQHTGNVGTNGGFCSTFGNVIGVMHGNDAGSSKCTEDMLISYNQLNNSPLDFFPASLLGKRQNLKTRVYSIAEAATLNLDLTLNAQRNSSAVFISKIQGSFSTNVDSKIKLIDGACNYEKYCF